MTPRLSSGTLIAALIRLTQSAGGFATILRKGDEGAGAILIQTLEKGRFSGLFERGPASSDAVGWVRIGPEDIEMTGQLEAYLDRRVKADPDLWLIELDIANAERFIVDSAPTG